MQRRPLLLALAALPAWSREAVIGGPCEGCEAVFEGAPAQLTSQVQIAPPDEPGERMQMEGRVLDAQGRAAAGVIVYAYHTDHQGLYVGEPAQRGRAAFRHGRLRAWARSDAQGRYGFDSIRPAGYPASSIPQHVHLHVIEPGRGTYWIADLLFSDDPRLGEAQRGQALDAARARGGPGLATPRREAGIWRVERNIQLGRNIPGYVT